MNLISIIALSAVIPAAFSHPIPSDAGDEQVVEARAVLQTTSSGNTLQTNSVRRPGLQISDFETYDGEGEADFKITPEGCKARARIRRPPASSGLNAVVLMTHHEYGNRKTKDRVGMPHIYNPKLKIKVVGWTSKRPRCTGKVVYRYKYVEGPTAQVPWPNRSQSHQAI